MEKKFVNDEDRSVNEKNASEFENLMKESSTDVDKYFYDSKNPVVIIILLALAAIIVFGCFIIFTL